MFRAEADLSDEKRRGRAAHRRQDHRRPANRREAARLHRAAFRTKAQGRAARAQPATRMPSRISAANQPSSGDRKKPRTGDAIPTGTTGRAISRYCRSRRPPRSAMAAGARSSERRPRASFVVTIFFETYVVATKPGSVRGMCRHRRRRIVSEWLEPMTTVGIHAPGHHQPAVSSHLIPSFVIHEVPEPHVGRMPKRVGDRFNRRSGRPLTAVSRSWRTPPTRGVGRRDVRDRHSRHDRGATPPAPHAQQGHDRGGEHDR